MKESALTRKMCKHMRAQGAFAAKIHGNMYTSGLPDIVGSHYGVFLGLEVKVPGREHTVTELQEATLRSIEKSGGIVRVVSKIEHIDEVLQEAEEWAAEEGG